MGTKRITAFALSLVLVFTAAPLVGIAEEASAEACTLEDDGDRPVAIAAEVPDEVDEAAGPALAYVDCQLERCSFGYDTVETPKGVANVRVPTEPRCTMTTSQYCPLFETEPASVDLSDPPTDPSEVPKPGADVNEDYLDCRAPACSEIPHDVQRCMDGLCLDRIDPKTGERLEDCLTITMS